MIIYRYVCLPSINDVERECLHDQKNMNVATESPVDHQEQRGEVMLPNIRKLRTKVANSRCTSLLLLATVVMKVGILCIPGQLCLLSRYSLVLTCVVRLTIEEEQFQSFRARGD